jgi:predicted RNase H-like nuclease (RuvC/YqgF family)
MSENRYKWIAKLDEFIDRQGIKSAELCKIIDGIEAEKNELLDIIEELKKAYNEKECNCCGGSDADINKYTDELKEQNKKMRELILELYGTFEDVHDYEPVQALLKELDGE